MRTIIDQINIILFVPKKEKLQYLNRQFSIFVVLYNKHTYKILQEKHLSMKRSHSNMASLYKF